MSSVKSSFAIAIGERGLLIAINLISYILVARLVTPEDVGLFSVASAFVAMLAIFRDFGSGYYIATQKHLTQEGFATAFTFSLLIGLLITGLVVFIAPLFGGFFDDARIETILKILAINAPILAVTGCLLTVLRRNFRYATVFWVNLTGTITGSVVTLALAYKNYGAYALASGVTANYLATASLSYLVRSGDYRLAISMRSWREVASFGGKTSVVGGAQQLSTSLLEILVGRYLGFHEAGLLSRAMGVVNLFNRDFSEAVRSVTIHSFSKAFREGQSVASLHSVYLVNYSAFGVFFFSFVWCFPREALYILSGAQWLDAEPYLRVFALMGMVTSFYQLLPILAISTGGLDDLVRVTIGAEAVKVAFGAIALHYVGGGMAYAFAWLISVIVLLFIYWGFLGHMRLRGELASLRGLAVGICVGWAASLASFFALRYLIPAGEGTMLVLKGVSAGLVALSLFVLFLRAVSHPLYLDVLRPIIWRFRGKSS